VPLAQTREKRGVKKGSMNNYPPEQFPATQPVYLPPRPGYPEPGGVPQPDDIPMPGTSRASRWIALIIVLLLIIAGSTAYYYFQVRSSPQKTLQAYCAAFENNDAQGLYNTFSASSQAQTSVSKIQTTLRLFDLVTDGGIRTCTVDDTQETGSTAIGTITLVANTNHSGDTTLHLIDENGTWKINDKSSLP
jgi:hypothetical protein